MKYLLFAICLLTAGQASAQVQVQYLYNPQLITQISEVFQVALIHPGAQSLDARIEISLYRASGAAQVYHSRKTHFTGNQTYLSSADFVAIQSTAAAPWQVEDIRRICYRVVSLREPQELFSDCLQPTTGPGSASSNLFLQADQLAPCQVQLRWTDPRPLTEQNYLLRIARRDRSQSARQDLASSPQAISLKLNSPQYAFVPNNPESQWYVWKVTALNAKGKQVFESEVDSFYIECGESGKTILRAVTDTYRKLSTEMDDNFYKRDAGSNTFRAFYTHTGNNDSLSYSVIPLATANASAVYTGKVYVRNGPNALDMNIGTTGYTSGQYYMIRMIALNGRKYYLKFKY